MVLRPPVLSGPLSTRSIVVVNCFVPPMLCPPASVSCHPWGGELGHRPALRPEARVSRAEAQPGSFRGPLWVTCCEMGWGPAGLEDNLRRSHDTDLRSHLEPLRRPGPGGGGARPWEASQGPRSPCPPSRSALGRGSWRADERHPLHCGVSTKNEQFHELEMKHAPEEG